MIEKTAFLSRILSFLHAHREIFKGGAKSLSSTVNKNVHKKNKKVGKGSSTIIPRGEKIVESRPLTDAEKAKWLEDRIAEYGTSSMLDPVAQGIKFLGSKISPGIFSDENYRKFLTSYQIPLIRADRELGAKLGKTRAGKLFKTVEDVPSSMYTTDKGSKVIGTAKEEVYRATAPVDKVKKVAFPMLGIFGIQQIADTVHGNKEGDDLVSKSTDLNLQRTAGVNSGLIEKISDLVNTRIMEKNSSLLKAADMLNKAVQEIKRLETELNKTSEDNKKLTLEIIAKERSRRSIKLAEEMVSKGLIKQADFDNEVDRIMDMNDNSFDILHKTVRNARKESVGVSDKLDRIAGIYDFSSDSRSSFKDELLKG